jgi:hypothetical protein
MASAGISNEGRWLGYSLWRGRVRSYAFDLAQDSGARNSASVLGVSDGLPAQRSSIILTYYAPDFFFSAIREQLQFKHAWWAAT